MKQGSESEPEPLSQLDGQVSNNEAQLIPVLKMKRLKNAMCPRCRVPGGSI